MASYYYISICDARGDLLKSPAHQGLWAEGHTEGHTVVPGVRPELHDGRDDLGGEPREFGHEYRGEPLAAVSYTHLTLPTILLV